jgi:polyisoprenoid-binding protein YceI
MSSMQTATPGVTYSIDPVHSSAHFKVRHMMVSYVRGEFAKVSGTAVLDSANPVASSVTAEIDVNSINTRDANRDSDLKSAAFLDAATYPTIHFQSKKVEAEGPENYKLTGDLTIHGVTREVVLQVEGPTPEVKDPWGYLRRGAAASTKINRKEFGLTYHQVLETGGLIVGDEVEITLEVELVRSA